MIDCREMMAGLSDYLDDALARDLKARIEAHLVACRTCQVLYDSTRKSLKILVDGDAFEVPPDLAERILRGLRKLPSGQA